MLSVMGGVRSIHDEVHFMSSLAWDGFCQIKLRYNLCPRWNCLFGQQMFR